MGVAIVECFNLQNAQLTSDTGTGNGNIDIDFQFGFFANIEIKDIRKVQPEPESQLPVNVQINGASCLQA